MAAAAKISKAELAAQARRAYIENTTPVAIDMEGFLQPSHRTRVSE